MDAGAVRVCGVGGGSAGSKGVCGWGGGSKEAAWAGEALASVDKGEWWMSNGGEVMAYEVVRGPDQCDLDTVPVRRCSHPGVEAIQLGHPPQQAMKCRKEPAGDRIGGQWS